MNVRLVTIAALAISVVILLGSGTPAEAYLNTTDFSFFDNSGGGDEGVQCSVRFHPFAYSINVTEWQNSPNVIRITLADGDFTRYKIAAAETLNLTGYARGGNLNQDFPDRCITVCGESTGLAGQVTVQAQATSQPDIKCNTVACPGGVAPACPFPFNQ